MSSDNLQHFSDDHTIDESISESQTERKVCFICGSNTTLLINIHEPRCGPNMIDVISEKFKMRPLNDDKFLCYSCNNWLVNWHTLQQKNDDSSHEDAQQTTSSTLSATATVTANAHEPTATKTSDGIRCEDDFVIISDDEDDENIDVNNVIQTLRSRLKKYLYYPNRLKSTVHEFHAHPHSADEIDAICTEQSCERCGKMIGNGQTQRTLCLQCRMRIRKNSRLRIRANHLKRSQRRRRPLHGLTKRNHVNIFEKLQQLGTSIYYENDCSDSQQATHRMTSISREMDTNAQKNITRAWQRNTNESNEILMTFNTAVTEVFPIDQLYGNYLSQPDDQVSNAQPNGDLTIQEILRNVPKSLTITIA